MRIRAAWLGIVAVVLTLAGASVLVPFWARRDYAGELIFVGAFAVLGVAGGVTGGVVAARVPENRMGWLILGQGVVAGTTLGCDAYALTPAPGHLQVALAGELAATFVAYGFTGALLLLFPTGRPLSPLWRFYVWFFVVTSFVASVVDSFQTKTLDPLPDNPFRPTGAVEHVVDVLGSALSKTSLPALLICAVCLVLRLVRSRGLQRQQLKLFTYCAAMAGLGLGLAGVTGGVFADVAWVAGVVGMLLLPVAAGLAVLRYGLYDIDLVIKRTLVYSVLTLLLLSTYLLLVLVLQVLLRPVTGRSDLAVATSTLVVAALFGPLRRTVQDQVDRRFFRARFDAAQTLDAFAERLRDEVDLSVLTSDLGSVVRQTLQPEHVSLWLRQERQR